MKRIVILLLLTLQTLCMPNTGIEDKRMITHDIKQCLKAIDNIEFKYLNIGKSKISKIPENQKPSSYPSLSELLSLNWEWDSKSKKEEEDSKKISFSTIDGLARTGMFMLEKCINVD